MLGATAGDVDAVSTLRRAAAEVASRSPGVAVRLLRQAEVCEEVVASSARIQW